MLDVELRQHSSIQQECYNLTNSDASNYENYALTEVWLVPANDCDVNTIYKVMTSCQLLNEDEDEDQPDLIRSDSCPKEAEQQLMRLNLSTEIQRFADADI